MLCYAFRDSAVFCISISRTIQIMQFVNMGNWKLHYHCENLKDEALLEFHRTTDSIVLYELQCGNESPKKMRCKLIVYGIPSHRTIDGSRR